MEIKSAFLNLNIILSVLTSIATQQNLTCLLNRVFKLVYKLLSYKVFFGLC